jgi:hypothetical protein
MTTFAAVFNNHTVAACAVIVSLAAAVRASNVRTVGVDTIRSTTPTTGRRGGRIWYATAGFFAGLAAAIEFPAAAYVAMLSLCLSRRRLVATALVFLPAAAVPVAALFLTNYIALGQLRPAYAEFGGPWYEYEGSYWREGAYSGIDAAGQTETKAEYAANLIFGHHGLFSLTPVFFLALLSLLGRKIWRQGEDCEPFHGMPAGPIGIRLVCGLAVVLSVIVVGFYVYKTANYGGRTCGPRWLLWLTPLLLLASLPAADEIAATRAGHRLGYGLLAVSVFSAGYPARTPWSHPWLYDLLTAVGWVDY